MATDTSVPRLTAVQEIEVRNLLKRIDEINAESVPLGLAISVFKAQNGHYPSDDLDRYEVLIDERETLMQYRAFEYVAPMLSEIAALRADLDAANARAANAERALQGLLDRYTMLIDSGDCGSWNPEEEDEVIAARKALTSG